MPNRMRTILVLAGDAFEAARLMESDRQTQEEDVGYLYVSRVSLLRNRRIADCDILVGERFQNHPDKDKITAAIAAAHEKRGAK